MDILINYFVVELTESMDYGCTRGGVVEIMKQICDIVDKEGLANDHPTLTKLLQQRLLTL